MRVAAPGLRRVARWPAVTHPRPPLHRPLPPHPHRLPATLYQLHSTALVLRAALQRPLTRTFMPLGLGARGGRQHSRHCGASGVSRAFVKPWLVRGCRPTCKLHSPVALPRRLYSCPPQLRLRPRACSPSSTPLLAWSLPAHVAGPVPAPAPAPTPAPLRLRSPAPWPLLLDFADIGNNAPAVLLFLTDNTP